MGLSTEPASDWKHGIRKVLTKSLPLLSPLGNTEGLKPFNSVNRCESFRPVSLTREGRSPTASQMSNVGLMVCVPLCPAYDSWRAERAGAREPGGLFS